jgi:hypothetical protein
MAATSFNFISGSPNCDHKAGCLIFERQGWREAAFRQSGLLVLLFEEFFIELF